MAEIHYSDLMRRGIIPAGARRIVRLGKDRYLVYLPRRLNYVWEELRARNTRVRVYIEVPSGDSGF
jgi:hypothetical protein